jgi:hypothetical protein
MDKRTLKRQYKESEIPAGIYRVVNTKADRSLVGSSVNLPAILNRRNCRRQEIVGGVYHPAIRLYSAPGRLIRIGELSFQRGATHHNPGNAEEVSTINKGRVP